MGEIYGRTSTGGLDCVTKLRYQLYVEKKATTDMKNMVDYGMAIQKK